MTNRSVVKKFKIFRKFSKAYKGMPVRAITKKRVSLHHWVFHIIGIDVQSELQIHVIYSTVDLDPIFTFYGSGFYPFKT